MFTHHDFHKLAHLNGKKDSGKTNKNNENKVDFNGMN